MGHEVIYKVAINHFYRFRLEYTFRQVKYCCIKLDLHNLWFLTGQAWPFPKPSRNEI